MIKLKVLLLATLFLLGGCQIFGTTKEDCAKQELIVLSPEHLALLSDGGLKELARLNSVIETANKLCA